MPRCSKLTIALASSLALIAGSTAAIADEVILRDGTKYEGTIITQTRREITIETMINNVRSIFTIELWKVRSFKEDDSTKIDALMEKSGASDDAEDDSASDGDDSISGDDEVKPLVRRDGHAYIMEVPLKGTFGEHIYPKPVAACLEWAVENGVTDVVFRINSPGGEVWAAQKIVEIMRRHEDNLRYHMLIESAISASIWPSFNCHTISMAPGADFGGAVVFRQTGTGSVEVDKKLTSIYAAKLGTSAEAKGYSAALSRAMMISEAEVYAYRRAGSRGDWQITGDSEVAKAPGNDWELVDGPDTVLTLTTKDAAKFGIVNELASRSIEDLATTVDIGAYDYAGNVGFELSETWGEKSDRMRNEILTTTKALFDEYGRLGASNLGVVNGAIINGKRELTRLRRLLRDAEDLEMETIVESFESLDLDEFENDFNRRKRDVRRALNGG